MNDDNRTFCLPWGWDRLESGGSPTRSRLPRGYYRAPVENRTRMSRVFLPHRVWWINSESLLFRFVSFRNGFATVRPRYETNQNQQIVTINEQNHWNGIVSIRMCWFLLTQRSQIPIIILHIDLIWFDLIWFDLIRFDLFQRRRLLLRFEQIHSTLSGWRRWWLKLYSRPSRCFCCCYWSWRPSSFCSNSSTCSWGCPSDWWSAPTVSSSDNVGGSCWVRQKSTTKKKTLTVRSSLYRTRMLVWRRRVPVQARSSRNNNNNNNSGRSVWDVSIMSRCGGLRVVTMVVTTTVVDGCCRVWSSSANANVHHHYNTRRRGRTPVRTSKRTTTYRNPRDTM